MIAAMESHHEEHEGHEEKFEPLSHRVLGLAIDVHRALGPGLLESAYERCLLYELTEAGLDAVSQVPIPVRYRGVQIECGYHADIIVGQTLLLELKSVACIEPVHEAQMITYLKLAGIKTGLLINFNVKRLRNGIRRFVL